MPQDEAHPAPSGAGADGSSATGRLRLGLLVSRLTLRRWQSDVVHSMLAVDGVELVLVVTDARRASTGGAARRLRRLVRSRTRLWDQYNNRWVGRRSHALEPGLDLADLDVARLEVEVERDGHAERFPEPVVDEIRARDLDVLLRFGFGIIRGPILDAARFGVWSFHHGDEMEYRGSPPGFWEQFEDAPVTGAVLQRLTDRLDGGHILRKGWFRTSYSYVRTLDAVRLGGAEWPAQVCRSILAGHGSAAEGALSTSTAPIRRKPSGFQTVQFLTRLGRRTLTTQVEAVRRADQWEVGVVDAPIHCFLEPDYRPEIRWLSLGRQRECYAADPFLIPGSTGPTLLYERFDRRRRIGQVWSAGLDGGQRRPSDLSIAAHASYPFVFEHDGRTYCVPQVRSAAVHLYELDGGSWKTRAPLLEESVLDPTIVCHDDRWWMFGTRPGRFSLTHLHVWWADQLTGPWHEHLRNPVKSDIRAARPAGTPFLHDGVLYRPAQDCSIGYGDGVALCAVGELTPETFGESVVNVVRPDPAGPFPAGLHTLSGLGDLTVLDGRRRMFEARESLAEIRARLNRSNRPW